MKDLVSVRQVREILRLSFLGLSQNEISAASGVARSTVQDYQRRIKEAGFSQIEDVHPLSEEELLIKLGKGQPAKRNRIEPNYQKIHLELKRKGVTLFLLWEEYLAGNIDGYSYSNFCSLYRTWVRKSEVSYRGTHKAGEKLYVDYAGHKLSYFERDSQQEQEVEIFVAAWGASHYIYAEASLGQDLSCWLQSHVNAFEFFGGLPEVVVPDNLKSGVKDPCRYEPNINPSYQQLAEHYGIAVVPTRVRKPKDKAKVEVGVQVVERRILAPLRDRRFYSLAELNQAIRTLLLELNNRQMQGYGCSRKELFEKIDKPALKPLPANPYRFVRVKEAKVNIDYHIEYERHYYSVPYELIRQTVEIHTGSKTVEIFYQGKQVALHNRSYIPHQATTCPEHMPPQHSEMKQWTPERFISWGIKIGAETAKQIEAILGSKKHPEQSYRSCLGLLRLEKQFGTSRLEAACRRANHFGAASRRSVLSILKASHDQLPLESQQQELPLRHENLRGSGYFH